MADPPRRPSSGPAPLFGRREERERALLLLYEAEQRDLDAEGILADQALQPEPYVTEVVRGVHEFLADIDATLSRLSTDWPLERMPAIDRALLRLGAYELGHRPEVPTAVVLNEAVELANSYSTDDSGRFVNGVLAAVAREARPDDAE